MAGMSSSDDEAVRIVYDAEFEPGEIAGIDGKGLQVGQRVILVAPSAAPGEPLEWPGVVEETLEPHVIGRWAGVRMASEQELAGLVTVSRADLLTVLDYARHFDIDDDPAMIRVTAAAQGTQGP